MVTEISSVSELIRTGKSQEERIEKWKQFWDEADRDRVENNIRTSGNNYHFRDHAFESFFSQMNRKYEPIAHGRLQYPDGALPG